MAPKKHYRVVRQNEGDDEDESAIDVLCGCGWGRLRCPLSQVPEYCPVCSMDLREALGDPAERFIETDEEDEEAVDDDDLNRN